MSSLSSVKLDDSTIQLSDTVKILLQSRSLELHLTLVSLWHLTLKQHPSLVSITYAPLGKSVHLWITLWQSLLVLLWSLSHLDYRYANSVLFGCLQKHAARLQRVQDLHWLPVRGRVDYKIAVLCYNAIKLQQPSYLTGLLSSYQ